MSKEPENETTKLTFHLEKSGLFRTVHVDGAVGGVTPSGNIHFATYSERLPIPKATVSLIDSKGQIVGESKEERDVRDGVYRELDVDLVMAPDVAARLAELLARLLSQRQDALEEGSRDS